MYNKGLVIIGLILFLLAGLSPFWLNYGLAKVPTPQPELPAIEAPEFHLPREVWKVDHMKNLDADKVTLCKACHVDTSKSCGRCHEFVGVKPSLLEK